MSNDKVMPKMVINHGEFSKLNCKVKVKWWEGMVNSFHLMGRYDATCHLKKIEGHTLALVKSPTKSNSFHLSIAIGPRSLSGGLNWLHQNWANFSEKLVKCYVN
jgi:hypothetical protein